MAKKSKGRKMLSKKTQVGCVTGLLVEEQFQVKGFPDEQTTVSSSGQQRAGWLVKRSPPPPVVLPSRDGPLEPRQENPWVNPHKTLCLWGPEVFPQYLPLSPLCGGHGVRRGTSLQRCLKRKSMFCEGNSQRHFLPDVWDTDFQLRKGGCQSGRVVGG